MNSNLVKTALISYFNKNLGLQVDAQTISVSSSESTFINANSNQASNSQTNDAIIAAIVVPIVVFFILASIGGFFIFKRYKKVF